MPAWPQDISTTADVSTSVSRSSVVGSTETWLITIGVDTYKEPAVGPLKCCAADARAMYEFFTSTGVPKDRAYLLVSGGTALDREPTQRNILRTVRYVCDNAGPDSTILFVFSGHGFVDEKSGSSYLLPEDGEIPLLEDTAVAIDRLNQLLHGSKCRRKVLFVDACRNAPHVEGKGVFDAGMAGRFLDALKSADGQVTLNSCDVGQVSFEMLDQGQSVFTHFVLEGLLGAADADGDGLVTLTELHLYLVTAVPAWCRTNLKTPQQPHLSGDMGAPIPLSIKDHLPDSMRHLLENTRRYASAVSVAPVDSELHRRARALFSGGIGLPQDRKAAYEQIKQAADSGDPVAKGWLAEALGGYSYRYLYRDIVKQDDEKAASLVRSVWDTLQKMADAGDVNALEICGEFLQSGIGVSKDEDRGVELWEKGAALGDSICMFHLGLRNPHKDNKAAAEFLEKAADLGHVTATHTLAHDYEGGVGVPKDPVRGFQLHQKAFDLGDLEGIGCLGRCYEKGIGVSKNPKLAFDLYHKYADLEVPEAIDNLARCYENGIGTENDPKRAFDLYKKSADLGVLGATENLARCYEKGIGVKVDRKKAMQLRAKRE